MKDFFDKVLNVFLRFSDWRFAVSSSILIISVAVCFYVMFAFLKDKNGKKLIWTFLVYILVGATFFVLSDLPNVGFIFLPLIFILGVILLYSVEIKRTLKFNSTKNDAKNVKNYDEEEVKKCISAIITALQNMSKKDIGAIIVLSNNNIPTQILDSGVSLNCDISAEIIESVFFPKTPLHDGAMIINGTKITSTGCFLPLSQNENIPKDVGTRHRAGIGLTETIDVTALIVSEETGIISIVKGGKMTRYADTNMLKNVLSKFYWQELTKTDR